MKILIQTDDGQNTLKEYFVSDEYIESAMAMIAEQIRVYIVEQEKTRLLADYDQELKDRVNSKISVVE